jgi:hypothetical protein
VRPEPVLVFRSRSEPRRRMGDASRVVSEQNKRTTFFFAFPKI